MSEGAQAGAGHEAEYAAIRKGIGITDRSEMGKFRVSGEAALGLLDRAVTCNVENLPENAIRLGLMLDEAGRILADVQVYNNFEDYIVTCDSPLRQPVLARLQECNPGGAVVDDISAELRAICVEGPRSWHVPQRLVGLDATGLRLLNFNHTQVGDVKTILARVGFTGEYGYLFFVPPESSDAVLARMREAAPEAVPCGREVHDLLRLEVRSFNLQLDVVEGETPLQVGLHWMIDFRKQGFAGSAALFAEKQRGVARRLVAFKCERGGEPRRGDALFDGEAKVGYVANAAHSPALGCAIGLAYLDSAYAWVGIRLELAAAGGRVEAHTVSAPFFVTESTLIRIS